MKGVQNSYGYPTEFSFDASSLHQTYSGHHQSASMGVFDQSLETRNGLQNQSFWPSNTMIGRIGSPATAFFATEVFMGLSQYDFQEKNTACSSQSGETRFFGDSLPRIETTSSQNMRPSGSYNMQFGDLDDSNRRSPSLPFDANHDVRVSQDLSASHFANVNQFGQQPGCHNAASSTKTRIRWSQDLHDRFVDCVNQLGGPDKATPKAIQKLMDTEGLTILHIKSHLQKYRNVYVPESAEGRSEKKSNTNNVVQIDIETGIQLKEALQLQLDVQRRLHEQLEIQRNLQVRIEEQGKQLQMMFEQQQKTAQHLSPNSKQCPNNLSPTLEDTEVLVAEESDDNGFPIEIN